MISYQITSTTIGIAIAVIILFSVRRDHLRGSYAVWWTAVATSVALLGSFPSLTNALAAWLGVAYPPALILVIGVVLMLVKMLTMDLERSRQERNLRRLTQRLAVLEKLLEDYRIKE